MGEPDAVVSVDVSQYKLSCGAAIVYMQVGGQGRVSLSRKDGMRDFVFMNSDPKLVRDIANCLLTAAKLAEGGR
jgi:hypothetical protein